MSSLERCAVRPQHSDNPQINCNSTCRASYISRIYIHTLCYSSLFLCNVHKYLVFCNDATAKLIVISEKLGGTYSILVDCISDSPKYLVEVANTGLLCM